MIRLYTKKHSLTVLLAVVCIGLVGCSKLQSNNDMPDLSSRPSSPTAAVITAGMDSLDTDLEPPGQRTVETNLMLPIVIKQSAPPAASETTLDINCTDTDPHPIGQSIAKSYGVSYQQVMTWFCRGYSFENILVALETSEAVDIPADTLLQMLIEMEWEEIWDEIGFVENQ